MDRRASLLIAPLAVLLLAAAVPSGAQDADSSWSALVAQAATALRVGDTRVAAAIAHLRALRPGSPVSWYLEARLHEIGGEWEAASQAYRQVLATPAIELTDEWMQLLAGRLVRAERAADARWVWHLSERSTTGPPADAALPLEGGRCLIVPPEVLLLDADGAVPATDLQAFSVAIAWWVILALRQTALAEPVGFHAANLMAQSVGLGSPAARAPTAVTLPGGALPPVSATLGVAQRLARLRPAGPPPGDLEGATPPSYFSGPPVGEWTPELARALAHFQEEHDLAPTGIPDPQTRLVLERVYREAQTRPAVLSADLARTDPLLAVARAAGAAAILSGTLERLPTGALAWNLVWLSARDGTLIGGPVAGQLPQTSFEPVWAHMLQLIIQASPFCARTPACAELSMPPPPSREGARLQGLALIALEAEQPVTAAARFAEAADRGAGQGARWYARAWALDAGGLDLLEQSLLDREILGPRRVPPQVLHAHGQAMAGSLWRHLPVSSGAVAGLRRDPGLSALPEHGWIRVSGEVD